MASGQRVLVVDELTHTAEVLRAVLGPRGVRVDQAPLRASGATRYPVSADVASRLSVVVIDEETASGRGFDRRHWSDVPQVLIANVPAPAGQGRTCEPGERVPTRYLSKPFHYADLVRAIESLIAER